MAEHETHAPLWRPYAALVLFVLAAAVIAGVWLTRNGTAEAPAADAPQERETVVKHAPRPKSTTRVYTSILPKMGWYPEDPGALAAEIDGFIEAADGAPLENVIALLLPHAGYRYSGGTAGYGLRALGKQQYTRVIVMGPSHRVALPGVASVPEGVTHYATPLGEIPLDTAFMAALKKYSVFTSVTEAHGAEHSVQVELPLLQHVLGDFALVPIVVGQLDGPSAKRMAEVLAGLMDDDTLLVVSSDFTHYGSSFSYVPFRDGVPEKLEELDMGAWKKLAAQDMAGFAEYVDETGATICGRCPLMVLTALLPEDAEAHLLHYTTSGAVTEDFTNSVSYISAAFTGHWPKGEQAAMASDQPLSEQDQEGLLRLARATIAYYLDRGTRPTPEDLGIALTPGMKSIMGAFVTLHKGENLRGCIGEIVPRRPLWEAVMDQAVNAAVNDPRFPPVQKDELTGLHLEISALSPSRPVDSYEDIEIGKHGMTIEKAGRRAVFLPQVAPEQGWDLATTLSHLAMKAGLPADAWKHACKFTVFEATVFGEEK